MATVELKVEVPDDEVAAFRSELIDLCYDFGLPVDDEGQYEDTEPGITDLPPEPSPKVRAALLVFFS